MATAVESVVELTSKKLEDARIKDKATYRAFVNRIAREDELKPKETEELSNLMIRLEIDADRFRADVDVLKELNRLVAEDYPTKAIEASQRLKDLQAKIREHETEINELKRQFANARGWSMTCGAGTGRIHAIKAAHADIIEPTDV